MLGLLAAACGPGSAATERARPDDDPSTEGRPLLLGTVGCAALTPSGRCILEPSRSLTLRIDETEGREPGELAVEIDGLVIASEVIRDEAGVTILLDIPTGARSVRVRGSDGAEASLTFEDDSPAFVAARDAALALVHSAEDWPAFERQAATVRSGLATLQDRHRFDCLMAAAAFEFERWPAVVAAAGTLDRAEEDLDVICVGQAQIQAAHVEIYYAPDYAAAVEHIAAARRRAPHLEAQISAEMLAGVLEQRLGRHEAASRWFEGAMRRANRVRRPQLAAAIAASYAMSLAELGQFARAEALAEEAIAGLPPGDPSAADLQANAAWVRILHRESDDAVADPTPQLETLLAEYTAAGDPVRASAVHLDAAIAAARSQRFDAAATHLHQVDRARIVGTDQIWFEWVAAQVARASHSIEAARQHLARARALADLHDQPALSMRVLAAAGRLEDAAGNDAAARAAYVAAEAAEVRAAQAISPMAGRSWFTSSRWRDRAHHIEFDLRTGDPSSALCTILGARARQLRGLRADAADHTPQPPDLQSRRAQLLLDYRRRQDAISARAAESWRLTLDELERMRERERLEREAADALLREAVTLGEVSRPAWTCAEARRVRGALLTAHPASERGQWWIFLDREGVVTAELVTAGRDPTSGLEDAIERVVGSGALDRVRDLTIIPIGALFDVDVHRLDNLVDRAELGIAYSLGLGATLDPPISRGHAVVVGEATNLRTARGEAVELTEQLQSNGTIVGAHWWPSMDSPPPELLHYAGHASRGSSAGWDSWIELGGRRVTAAELVVAGRSPLVVVLSACDAGAVDASIGDGGMNMASAFLLAGAKLVIAPTRAVDDAVAKQFSLALHAALGGSPLEEDPTQRIVTAVAELHARDPRFDPWRVWIP